MLRSYAAVQATTGKHPTQSTMISWGGIGADKADTLYSLAKECGFDMHLALHMILPSQLLHARTEHAFCVDVYDIAGWRLVGWCD